MGFEKGWRPERDSDPRPTTYEAAALTAELPGHSTIRVKPLFLRKSVELDRSDDAVVYEFLDLVLTEAEYPAQYLLAMLA